MNIHKIYKNDIGMLKPLFETDKEKHFDLNDTERNRNTLALELSPMIESISYSYSKKTNDFITMDDLLQEAYYGGGIAINNWFEKSVTERKEHNSFREYAYIWVKKYVKLYITRNSHIFTHSDKLSYEVADECVMMDGDDVVYSDSNNTTTLYDTIMDDSDSNIVEVNNLVNNILNDLSENERRLIKSHYGLEGESLSFQRLATEMGQDKTNVYRRFKEIMKKICNISENRKNEYQEILGIS